MMRRLVVAIVVVLAGAASAAAQPAVFLVRHAERADTATSGQKMMANDPELSAAGLARAESLAAVLEDAKIAAIYTTEFRRTKQTAAPLAKRLGIEAATVPSKDIAGLADKIRSAKGNVLVVGHSNTLPEIIKLLGVAEPVSIGESDFDNLFVVSQGTLLRLHY